MTAAGGGRLAGRVAIVAGAGSIGSGLSNGRAAAVIFAREGARVVAVDRSEEAATETVEAIRAEGYDALAVRADVTDADDCARMVDAAVQHYGRLDVLHNNVGILRRGGIADQTLDDWESVLRANLTGAFLTCRAAVPVMRATGGGSIVNVSSAAGTRYLGVPYIAYSASKAGLLQLTTVAAVEQAPHGIRVNAVVPGLIDTPMAAVSLQGAYGDAELAELRRARAQQVPMGRLGEPWDVARAALFLASDEAAYITGAHLVVDGGLTAKC